MRSTYTIRAALVALAIFVSTTVCAGPPAQSGVVTRGQDVDFGTIVDQKAGLLLVLGLDPVEFCSGIFDPDEVELMVVDIPSDPDRFAVFLKGELFASVWDFVEFDCDLFMAVQPLATGMAMSKSTDNDFFVSSGPNSNAFGFTAHGTLYDPMSGEARRLNAVYRALWDKELDEPVVKSAKVVLR